MTNKIRLYKIKGVPSPKDFEAMTFGRQIDILRSFEEFKANAKLGYVSQKRQSYKKGIKEFIDLNNVKEYYCCFNASEFCFDDSFEFYYR